MFGQLVYYRDEDFYKAHPTFTFDTLYEHATWQVVAALDTALGADEHPYYTFFDAANKLDWQRRVEAITELALYDTGVTPEYGTQLLTLSTCGDTRPDTDTRKALVRYAAELGLVFQIVDDILDVTSTTEELGKPVGSDADNDKTTFITLYGLQGAHEEAERHNAAALAALDALGPKADFLRLMAAELLERKK